MTIEVEKLVYSVPETAKALGLSRSNTYDLVARGIIPSIKIRGRVLVSREAVRELLSGAGKEHAKCGVER